MRGPLVPCQLVKEVHDSGLEFCGTVWKVSASLEMIVIFSSCDPTCKPMHTKYYQFPHAIALEMVCRQENINKKTLTSPTSTYHSRIAHCNIAPTKKKNGLSTHPCPTPPVMLVFSFFPCHRQRRPKAFHNTRLAKTHVVLPAVLLPSIFFSAPF